jgi:hypothetical protein
LAQFFVFYASGWQGPTFRVPWQPGGDDFVVAFSVLSLSTSTLIFMAASCLLLLRWDPPFGTFAALMGIIGLGLQGVHGFERSGELVGALIAGVILDVLALRLRPAPTQSSSFRVWCFVAPIVVWSIHAIYLALIGDFGWPPVLWGAIILQGLLGLGVSVVSLPPALPLGQSKGPT